MKKYIPLIIILAAAALLRLYNITAISLWHDEAFSALMIRYPWHEMFYRLGLDVHPPMYYIFLREWHYVFGNSIWSLRGFSLLFGVLTVWAVWLFVGTAFKDKKMANWAAILAAINPFAINYVTEARMYTMGAFFGVLAAYFLVKALHEQKSFYDDEKLNMPNLPQDIKLKKNYLWNYFGFFVCTAIIILTHYYLLFTAAALGIYGLMYLILHYRTNFKRYGWFVASWVLVFLAFLPWLKIFISQVKSVQQSYWIPAVDIWSIPGTLWSVLLGIGHDNTNHTTQFMMVVVLLFSIYFFYSFLRKNQMAEKWLVFFATIAPFFGALAFVVLARLKGSTSSVYEERYFLFAGVFYIIALAGWLAQIKNKTFAAVLFVIYCLFNLYAFAHYWNSLDVADSPGMNGAAKFLGANVAAGQQVFVGTSFEFFNYKYYQSTYYPTPLPPLLFTNGRSNVSQISSVEGVAMLSNGDLGASFSQNAHPGDTAWLLWTNGFSSSKPQVPLNWVQVDEKQYPDVRPNPGTIIYVDEYKVN